MHYAVAESELAKHSAILGALRRVSAIQFQTGFFMNEILMLAWLIQ